ncbi:MAG: tetratricopeptide repeat protein [Ardenticatenaceae bacterium]
MSENMNKALLAFVEASSWPECKAVVETLHDLLLTDAADQMLALWIEKSEGDVQATRVFDEYRQLLARCRREGIEAAFADRVRPPQEVYEAVLAFVQADNWAHCKRLVQTQAHLLLTGAADRVLASWLKQSQSKGDAHGTHTFEEYRRLLANCRREGIHAAFADRVRPPQKVFDVVRAFVEARSQAESQQILQAEQDLLLSEAADQVFVIWLKQSQKDPKTAVIIEKKRARLARARREGIEAAFAPREHSAQELSEAVQGLINAKNLAESKQIVEAQRDLLLTDAADQLFGILLSQVKAGHPAEANASRVLQKHRDLLARCRREGIEAGFAAAARFDQELSSAIWAFVNASSWGESKQVVEAQRDLLLSEAADRFLAQLLKRYQNNSQATTIFQEHRDLLLRCRREGIEAAFRRSTEPLPPLSEALWAFVDAKDLAERRQIVEAQPDLLLSEAADQLFGILLEESKADPERSHKLQTCRELLKYCRDEGIKVAFSQPMRFFDISPELRARLVRVKSKQEFNRLVKRHPELLSMPAEIDRLPLLPSFQPAPSSRPSLPNEELAKKLFTFVAAQSWPESKAYLEQHRDLLSDEVDHMLAELLAQEQAVERFMPNKEQERSILQEHRDLLAVARSQGIDAAFADLAPTSQQVIPSVRKFVKAKSWQERKQLVEAERDLLLSDAAEELLGDLLTQYKENTSAYRILTARRTLLGQARRKGIEAAFAIDMRSKQPAALSNSQQARSKKPAALPNSQQARSKQPAALPNFQQSASQEPAAFANSHQSRHQEPAAFANSHQSASQEPAAFSNSHQSASQEPAAFSNSQQSASQKPSASRMQSEPFRAEVSKAVFALLRADTLNESRRVIEQYEELFLSDNASFPSQGERALEKLLRQSQEDPHAMRRLEEQRALLAGVRRNGMDATFGIRPPAVAKSAHSYERAFETVLKFVESKNWDESKRIVQAQRDLLLSDEAERVLTDLLAQHQNNSEIVSVLEEHRDLLRQIRRDGIETAFANHQRRPIVPDVPPELAADLQKATAARERLKQDQSQQAFDAAVTAWRTLFKQPTISQYPNFAADVQSELGSVLLRRYWALEQAQDLDAAVRSYEDVLNSTPPNAFSLPGRLNNLGLALRARFELHRRIEDLNAAITAYKQALKAIKAISPDANERSSILNNLGVALSDRFALHKQAKDLQKAIALYQDALNILPVNASNRPAVEKNLQVALQEQIAFQRPVQPVNVAVRV